VSEDLDARFRFLLQVEIDSHSSEVSKRGSNGLPVPIGLVPPVVGADDGYTATNYL
jgi:hypothetical protein